MIRKKLKNTHNNKSIQTFLEKYKVPKEFISTTRKMIGRGVSIGLFIAMIPMPFQMVAVLLFIPFLRFNLPIALIMCWVTNPFTMPFIYYIEYMTGSFFLGIDVQNVQMTVEWFQSNFQDIIFPLYLGAIFYSIVVSWIAYYILIHVWKNSVHKDRKKL
jgi:uncharacterized protein (DUF2062 family)